jgi:hypothetical protein
MMVFAVWGDMLDWVGFLQRGVRVAFFLLHGSYDFGGGYFLDTLFHHTCVYEFTANIFLTSIPIFLRFLNRTINNAFPRSS